jgi:hypothetical protein
MVHPRQFPPPWRVEEQEEAYVVTDGLGQRLAFVYFENEAIRRGADSWPAATRLAFVPAKPELELGPSFFLKRREDARSSKIRRDEGCTRTVSSRQRPLPIKETVQPICNSTD